MALKNWSPILLGALLIVGLAGCQPNNEARMHYGKIGTGTEEGLYYQMGVVLAEMVNEKSDQNKIDLAVEATGGSVANINGLVIDNLDFGFAQADQEYDAYQGHGYWENDPQQNLRFICTLYAEMVTLLAADSSGINQVADLKGKMINIGSPGSGTWENALDVLSEVNLEEERDFHTKGGSPSAAVQLLQDGGIDAFFYTVGHPNQVTTEATVGVRKVHFVPVTGLDALIARDPYYQTVEIPTQLYPRATNTAVVPTIGMKARLLTSADVSDDMVYVMTKTIFDNLDQIKGKNPVFANLKKEEMIQGGFAPIHPGALRYYKEVGLIKQ